MGISTMARYPCAGLFSWVPGVSIGSWDSDFCANNWMINRVRYELVVRDFHRTGWDGVGVVGSSEVRYADSKMQCTLPSLIQMKDILDLCCTVESWQCSPRFKICCRNWVIAKTRFFVSTYNVPLSPRSESQALLLQGIRTKLPLFPESPKDLLGGWVWISIWNLRGFKGWTPHNIWLVISDYQIETCGVLLELLALGVSTCPERSQTYWLTWAAITCCKDTETRPMKVGPVGRLCAAYLCNAQMNGLVQEAQFML